VLLSPPNEKGIKNLGATNLCDVLLFDEILADLGKHLDDQEIVAAIKEDVTKVLSILRSPTQGRRLKHSFLRVRGSSTSVLSCPPVDSHGS
jgi:hypothetical protein